MADLTEVIAFPIQPGTCTKKSVEPKWQKCEELANAIIERGDKSSSRNKQFVAFVA